MLNEVNAHISILRMLTTTAEQCKTLHFNVTCSKHSVQLAEIRSKSLLEMCKVTNKPLLQMRHVQSHPLCKLARSQNCSYKLTDDMIYCWLGPFSRSSVAWRGSQSQVSKGFTAYREKLARWRRDLIIA